MKFGISTLLNITLATVLLASIFLVNVIPSSSVGEYDPWEDLNEDGAINIFDLVQMAGDYGTTGDPAKNVSVTNLPLDESGNLKVASVGESKLVTICYNLNFSLPIGDQMIGSCDVSGWKYVTVWWSSVSTAPFAFRGYYTVEDLHYIALDYPTVTQVTYVGLSSPCPAPTLEFFVDSSNSGEATLTAYVYLSM